MGFSLCLVKVLFFSGFLKNLRIEGIDCLFDDGNI